MRLVSLIDNAGQLEAGAFCELPKGDRDWSQEALVCMALCNTVIVFRNAKGEIEYNAESPDEAAFVEFAAQNGVRLIDRQPEFIVIEVHGKTERYEIHSNLPFNSTR
jgi:phospholipid-transporting ATPase